ncbi:MAG: type II secretion system protein [Tenericutes bacterium]|nr:type II secretion system protein [Mycoplasmatota bacterium]
MKNKGRGFTLVELLAVIVILAVILVIAVPKVSEVINSSKKASFESSAKTIASQAEKKKMEKEILEDTGSINCSDVVKLNNTDYGNCSITFDGNTAKVTLVGKGKFEGLQIINGTKDNAKAEEIKAPVYGNAVNYVNGLYAYDASSNGLEKDTTSDANIRYVGANPNNYVEFNGETWRIIGVFGSNLKLVRDDILTTYSFDNKTTAQGIETNYGTNDWTKSYLREFLNDYYYGGKTITCHSETSGSTATNATITCPDINKISSSAKNMIEKTTWNLGGTGWKVASAPYETYTINELYQKERETKVYSGHATISSDYIGLIYPSEYGYASTDTSCRQNLRAGLTYANSAYSGTPTCQNNNWLYKSGIWYWTISPASASAYYVFIVHGDGNLGNYNALYRGSVRPSLYLKPDVKVVGGTGTSSDPYTLEI